MLTIQLDIQVWNQYRMQDNILILELVIFRWQIQPVLKTCKHYNGWYHQRSEGRNRGNFFKKLRQVLTLDLRLALNPWQFCLRNAEFIGISHYAWCVICFWKNRKMTHLCMLAEMLQYKRQIWCYRREMRQVGSIVSDIKERYHRNMSRFCNYGHLQVPFDSYNFFFENTKQNHQ